MFLLLCWLALFNSEGLAQEEQLSQSQPNTNLSLIDAIRSNDTSLALQLLNDSVDVNQSLSDGSSALHWAVFHQQYAVLEALLKKRAQANSKNKFDVTPLEIAVQAGDLKAVEFLLAHDADPNLARTNGESPLMFAARVGRVKPVRALLDAEADPNAATDYGQTALMWAANEGHADVVRILLESGAERDAALDSGFNAFFFAVRNGHREVVRLFLDRGVDVNRAMSVNRGGRLAPRKETSALILAIENGHFELAKMLLESGADPNDQRTRFGPLHTLTWVRKPNRGDGEDGQPAPQGSGSLTSLQLVDELLKHGAEINLRLAKNPGGSINREGATPFFMAADTADLPLMKKLLEQGADPTTTNVDGSTPLMMAAGLGTYAPGEEAGTEEEAIEAVKLLLELGVDINAKDKNGETAMHGAAYKNLPNMVRLLHERGADYDIWMEPNRRGWTPIAIAEGYRPGNFKPAPSTLAALREISLGK